MNKLVITNLLQTTKAKAGVRVLLIGFGTRLTRFYCIDRTFSTAVCNLKPISLCWSHFTILQRARRLVVNQTPPIDTFYVA